MTDPPVPPGRSRRARAFLGRRFAPGVYLGLHLTLSLLLFLAAFALFALIAANVEWQGPLVRLDNTIAARLGLPANHWLEGVFHAFTFLGSTRVMEVLAGIAALVLCLRRQWLLAVAVVLTALGGGLLDLELKEVFQRTRPPLPNHVIKERNWSFPSGHSMGSIIGYGFLAYLVVLAQWRSRKIRAGVLAGLVLLVLLIGMSRLYLRAHWFSDVLGGYAAGLLWLAVCISTIEFLRRRRVDRCSRPEANHPDAGSLGQGGRG